MINTTAEGTTSDIFRHAVQYLLGYTGVRPYLDEGNNRYYTIAAAIGCACSDYKASDFYEIICERFDRLFPEEVGDLVHLACWTLPLEVQEQRMMMLLFAAEYYEGI